VLTGEGRLLIGINNRRSAIGNSLSAGDRDNGLVVPLKTMMRRFLVPLYSMILAATPAATLFAWQPPPGQGEFVPVSSLPPSDQLPSAPLLIGAYAFVWVAIAVYLWSIWARLGRVERDMRALELKMSRGSR
jgi:CcmD family protein